MRRATSTGERARRTASAAGLSGWAARTSPGPASRVPAGTTVATEPVGAVVSRIVPVPVDDLGDGWRTGWIRNAEGTFVASEPGGDGPWRGVVFACGARVAAGTRSGESGRPPG